MSNVETQKLYVGEYVRAESLTSREAMKRPIYFKGFWNGSYISIEQAERLAAELTQAVSALRAGTSDEPAQGA